MIVLTMTLGLDWTGMWCVRFIKSVPSIYVRVIDNLNLQHVHIYYKTQIFQLLTIILANFRFSVAIQEALRFDNRILSG